MSRQKHVNGAMSPKESSKSRPPLVALCVLITMVVVLVLYFSMGGAPSEEVNDNVLSGQAHHHISSTFSKPILKDEDKETSHHDWTKNMDNEMEEGEFLEALNQTESEIRDAEMDEIYKDEAGILGKALQAMTGHTHTSLT